MQNEWRDFNGGAWENEVNVRDFIQRNYKPYDGDSSFLEGPTEDTTALWQDVLEPLSPPLKSEIRLNTSSFVNQKAASTLRIFVLFSSG